MDMVSKHMVVNTEEWLSNRTNVEGMDLGRIERVHGGLVML
jgi:hypothetical protein